VSRLRVRLASIAALVLLFSYLAIANFVPEATRVASPLLPDKGLRLGLDRREETTGDSDSDGLGGIGYAWGLDRRLNVRASAAREAIRYSPRLTDNGILVDDLGAAGRTFPELDRLLDERDRLGVDLEQVPQDRLARPRLYHETRAG